MKSTTQEELSKLQVVCSLFSNTIGDDLYYARQIKETIEASLPASENQSTEPFVRRAKELVEKIEGRPDQSGFGFVNADQENTPFSLLTLRSQLLAALKATYRFESGLIVITGLKSAICPPRSRWTNARKREYEDAVNFSRTFTLDRSRPSSKLSLIIL